MSAKAESFRYREQGVGRTRAWVAPLLASALTAVLVSGVTLATNGGATVVQKPATTRVVTVGGLPQIVKGARTGLVAKAVSPAPAAQANTSPAIVTPVGGIPRIVKGARTGLGRTSK